MRALIAVPADISRIFDQYNVEEHRGWLRGDFVEWAKV
jgi:hypothetical protein